MFSRSPLGKKNILIGFFLAKTRNNEYGFPYKKVVLWKK